MKRASIIEDWSRFNRAVLEIADGRPVPAPQKQPEPQQPTRESTELVSDPADRGDTYRLIARDKSRKHA